MRWGVALVLSALFVAGAVLSLLQLRPETPPLPEVAGEFERRVWVAAFSADALGPATSAGLAAIADAVGETPVILFHPAATALSEPLPRGVRARPVDSGTVAELARGFGLEPVAIAQLDDPALVLTSVDRTGATRVTFVLTPNSAEGTASALLEDVRFLQSLEARPRLHALLNGTSAVLLSAGLFFIRRKKIAPHVACMVSAGLVTSGFLVSYLYYHYHAGSVSYPGSGWMRAIYFGVLLSHTVLAAFVVPLAVGTFALAARRRFRLHSRLARWTLPIWLYVSITGVVIYWMLYV